jgi:hypothetical protein
MNDVMKKVLFALGGAAGIMAAVLPAHTVAARVAMVLLGLIGGGGMVSTGTTKPEA